MELPSTILHYLGHSFSKFRAMTFRDTDSLYCGEKLKEAYGTNATTIQRRSVVFFRLGTPGGRSETSAEGASL